MAPTARPGPLRRVINAIGVDNLSLIIALAVLVLLIATISPALGIQGGQNFWGWQNLMNSLAQSIVNLGGFLASLLVLATMGAVLEALGGFTPDAFRVAWLVQYPVWLFAVVGIVTTRRKARRIDAARGVVPRPLREVVGAGLRRS